MSFGGNNIVVFRLTSRLGEVGRHRLVLRKLQMADSEDEFGEEIWKENGSYMGLDDGDESEEEEHLVGFVELYHLGLRRQEI